MDNFQNPLGQKSSCYNLTCITTLLPLVIRQSSESETDAYVKLMFLTLTCLEAEEKNKLSVASQYACRSLDV
jgi:hypothetical protein